MNHSFHLMKKNVVYLDWSEKQNLSTLRKTYADDNNVVSSLRSLTTYHYQRSKFLFRGMQNIRKVAFLVLFWVLNGVMEGCLLIG